MATDLLTTYQDLVDHIIDVFGESRDGGRIERLARRAALEAYRDLTNAAQWKYLYDRRVFASTAAYRTGTAAYTESTRTATITGGTLPSDLAGYYVTFGTSTYNDTAFPIDKRLSDTTFSIVASQTPGADIPALTPYTVFKQAFTLPEDFREIGRLIDLVNQYEMRNVDVDLNDLIATFVYDSPDTAWQFTIRGDPANPGRMAIILVPAPSTVRTYQYSYFRVAHPLRNESVADGTVTIASGSTAVSGTGTAFDSSMAGSVFRIGTTTAIPVGLAGSSLANSGPFVEQHIIESVTDATNLVLQTPASSSYTSVLYSISDLVDIRGNAMLTALHRFAELSFSRLSKRYDNTVAARQAAAMMALALAKEADVTSTIDGSNAYYNPFSRVQVTTDSG